MLSLNVKKDLEMSKYAKDDPRIFVVGHKADALSGYEVNAILGVLGDDFGIYFEAGDESTANFLNRIKPVDQPDSPDDYGEQ